MKPFCVKVMLGTPVALGHPWLSLDGVLEFLAEQRVFGREFYARTSTKFRDEPGRLGQFAAMLDRWNDVPCASVSHWPCEIRAGMQRFYKRTELDGFPGRKVHIDGFTFKSVINRAVYLSAPFVEFYGRGQIDMVTDLLRDLTHLGKLVNQGWGSVRSVEVTEMREDRSLTFAGKATRPIPSRLLASCDDVAMLKWSCPYWAREAEPCAVPGSAVELAT